MKRTACSAALICVGALALLAGCTTGSAPRSDRPSAAPGPTATTTVAPAAAVQLADRYRQSGGARDVYGIQRSSGPAGVPLLVVWTRDPDDSAETFDDLKGSIIGFLQREEGLSLRRGYLMDVFGRDGSLQHRLDARP
ncbi:hypothetical protein H9Y04_40210 [Streptomyces sp. TRM66268-LWL]|uniref:Lipoprotein n=1 Tax=Streptomyces polyasparticus TaxID=2767826 RepID=A0ABR7STF0_9ACTN|nr:hypothetical protein [Streptomyces polyasparticus]MBC9718770.1 hypothetical protein [Streptomyces polyasparticus]